MVPLREFAAAKAIALDVMRGRSCDGLNPNCCSFRLFAALSIIGSAAMRSPTVLGVLMTQRVPTVAAAILITFMCGMSVWAVMVLPAQTQVAIHWSRIGIPDGFVTVPLAASIGPVLALVASVVCALLMWLAKIVPDHVYESVKALPRITHVLDLSDLLAGLIAVIWIAVVVVFAVAHGYIMYGAIFGMPHGA